METVTYKKACKNCKTTTGVDHMIMMQDDHELYVDGNIISANELTKKILQWHYDTEFQCQNCGAKNVWDIWDVAIGGQKLQSNGDLE